MPVLMAYKYLSSDPTYTVPSGPSAGDDLTLPLVLKFHLRTPFELMAYRKLSSDPTYTVPSGPSAGFDLTRPVVEYFHFRTPDGLMA